MALIKGWHGGGEIRKKTIFLVQRPFQIPIMGYQNCDQVPKVLNLPLIGQKLFTISDGPSHWLFAITCVIYGVKNRFHEKCSLYPIVHYNERSL